MSGYCVVGGGGAGAGPLHGAGLRGPRASRRELPPLEGQDVIFRILNASLKVTLSLTHGLNLSLTD